jgi:hypothetical protein
MITLAVMFLMCGVLTSQAFATLEDTPTPVLGTSGSNPGWGADSWWRDGWGNSFYPDFELNPPGGTWDENVDGYLLGTIYAVDRSDATVIDTSTPDAYYRDSFPVAITSIGGTNLTNKLDMLGIYMNPPAGGWPAAQAGAKGPLEGSWHYHYTFYSNFRYQSGQWDLNFGIDQTPPRAVTGLRIRTGLTSSDVTTWTPARRALVSWDASQTDDLAGVGYYQVMVDDRPLIPETSSTPTQGRVYSSPLYALPNSIAVEDMPPGAHKVSVVCVDRATNVGPPTSGYFYSDPDTPTIAFTSPVSGVLNNRTLFSVTASDAAGDPKVEFYLNGTGIATITAPPYSFKPDLSAVPSGNQTLTATVTDHFNRKVTVSKVVSWNNVATSTGFMIASGQQLLYSVPTSSATNPPDDPWRVTGSGDSRIAWGRSLSPTFELPADSETTSFTADDRGTVIGLLYNVRRSPELIEASVPDRYFRSILTAGTLLNASIDMPSVLAYPPAGGWPAPDPGAENPAEGIWYLHYKPFTDAGWADSGTDVVKFGIDLTPPSPPGTLTASPTTDTAMSGEVTPGGRIHLAWITSDWDALSGVAYYQVLLDGAHIVPNGADINGRVVDMAGRAQPAVTIENLTAGKHTLAVEVVDRAGNVGRPSSIDVYSDPDTPTVSITSPSGSSIGVKPTITANASDAGGVVSVVFRLDGTTLATDTSAPYSINPDLSSYSAGTHTLSATVTDHYGRQVTKSKTVTLDKTPLTLSSLKASCSKRKVTVQFVLNRAASAKLALKVAGTSKTLTSSSAAKYTFTYTYPKKSSRYPSPLSFSETYTISATDSLGNSLTKTGKVTIKIARLVKLSGNKVKIVYY